MAEISEVAALSNLAEHYRRRGNLEKYEHYKAQAIAAGETINQPQRDAEIVEQALTLFHADRAVALRALFDKHPHVKLLASMVSALALKQGDPDAARTAIERIADEQERQLKARTASLLPELNKPLPDEPKVHLLLLCHNREKFIPEAIRQLAKTEYSNYEVFIADNASEDGSLAALREAVKAFPPHVPVHIETFPTNIGRPAGHNWLLTKYDHSAAQYIAIADDDLMEIPPDWLRKMILTHRAFPSAAVVGGKALNPGLPRIIHGGVRRLERFEQSGFTMSNEAEVLDYGQFDYIDQVDHVIGCLHIYDRKALLDDIGLFDIRFSPCQCVDIEHHLRTRLKGYQIIYNGLIEFVHYRGMGRKAAKDRAYIGNSIGNAVKLIYKYDATEVHQKISASHAERNQ